jgi:putative oxidoreductase
VRICNEGSEIIGNLYQEFNSRYWFHTTSLSETKGSSTMIDQKNAALAAFALRLSLGVMYLAHGVILKYMTFTLAGTAQFFESLGLPAALAYLTFAGETLGGIALVLGFKSRLVSLALSPILLGAFWVHSGNGWVFSSANGGWEYPLFLVIISGVVALLGNGAYAVENLFGKSAQTVRA